MFQSREEIDLSVALTGTCVPPRVERACRERMPHSAPQPIAGVNFNSTLDSLNRTERNRTFARASVRHGVRAFEIGHFNVRFHDER